MRSQLEHVWKQSGIKPAELEVEPIPTEFTYLVEIFYELWNSEGIKWSEIYFYQLVMGLELEPWEIKLLKEANQICSQWVNEQYKPKKPNNKKG